MAVGNLSTLEKAFTRCGVWSSSSNKKFMSLQSDLEIIETQLWNLTGASGGGITSKTQSLSRAADETLEVVESGFIAALNKIILGERHNGDDCMRG